MNYLGLVFTSGPDVVQSGFKATVSLLTGTTGATYLASLQKTKQF